MRREDNLWDVVKEKNSLDQYERAIELQKSGVLHSVQVDRLLEFVGVIASLIDFLYNTGTRSFYFMVEYYPFDERLIAEYYDYLDQASDTVFSNEVSAIACKPYGPRILEDYCILGVRNGKVSISKVSIVTSFVTLPTGEDNEPICPVLAIRIVVTLVEENPPLTYSDFHSTSCNEFDLAMAAYHEQIDDKDIDEYSLIGASLLNNKTRFHEMITRIMKMGVSFENVLLSIVGVFNRYDVIKYRYIVMELVKIYEIDLEEYMESNTDYRVVDVLRKTFDSGV